MEIHFNFTTISSSITTVTTKPISNITSIYLSPPAVGPVRPNNFCSFPTTRSIISGRRIKSTLSGIRPCYGPRVANSGECCSQCQADPTCIAWTFTKPMDCRGQGIPDVASTGACYLIEEETGSYEPLLSFDYVSGWAFSKRSH